MLNKEKYAQEIVEIAINGNSIAIVNNKPCSCGNVEYCSNCDLSSGCDDCDELLKQWANSEYKEREIDWSKVPVDTPIYVWDNDEDKIDKRKRYFAEYDTNNDKIIAFTEGQTSWSSDQNIMVWDNAEIKEGIDCSEWYKD